MENSKTIESYSHLHLPAKSVKGPAVRQLGQYQVPLEVDHFIEVTKLFKLEALVLRVFVKGLKDAHDLPLRCMQNTHMSNEEQDLSHTHAFWACNES